MKRTRRRHGRLAGAGALLLAVAVIGAALLIGYRTSRSSAAQVPYPHELAQVSFAVAGDVIPHEPVRAAATAAGEGAAGWGALFSDVADVFKSADFGFVNLETPVAPAHSRGSKPFMFDAPIALIDALKANGIKIVSFANNHVMDQGWAGFAETREHLREQGLLFVGSGDTVFSDSHFRKDGAPRTDRGPFFYEGCFQFPIGLCPQLSVWIRRPRVTVVDKGYAMPYEYVFFQLRPLHR